MASTPTAGSLWALGLLVAGAANASGGLDGTVTAAAALASIPDATAPPSGMSHGQRAARAHGARGALGEAQAGFPHATQIGLPVYRVRNATHGTRHAALDALVTIMASLDDTCVLHRGGPAALAEVKDGARRVLEVGGSSTSKGMTRLVRFDTHLAVARISPGRSADLLAATLLLDTLTRPSSPLPSAAAECRRSAVLLYGDLIEIPSFRWFEKDSGRRMVVNHPRDAAEIQRRLSTGRSLLADGGVSVSNLWSGDAPVRLLTMSDARLPSMRTQELGSFVSWANGLARFVVVAGGKTVTELYDGRRQRRDDVRPRVKRGLVFAIQRAVTTALLRDLDVAIVVEQLARGAPAIYVDFVDYDEVAHHARPSLPESMGTIQGFDRLARFLADVVPQTERGHEIVVVSDHGRSQGATFAQLDGRTLPEVVADLAAPAGTAAGATPAALPLGIGTRRRRKGVGSTSNSNLGQLTPSALP